VITYFSSNTNQPHRYPKNQPQNQIYQGLAVLRLVGLIRNQAAVNNLTFKPLIRFLCGFAVLFLP
jgi:hypothetical protein